MNVPSHPVLSCAEAKAWESRLLADESAEWAAMQRAGVAIAREILEDYREIGGFPENGRMLVLAGKGHNSGDALLAAGEILQRFPQASAEVLFAFGEKGFRPLAAKAWGILRRTGRARGMGLLGPPKSADAGGQTRVQASNVAMGQAASATGLRRAEEPRATLDASYDLCLDGVFGLQFRRPLDEPVAELLARVNTHPRIRVRAAVDLPSGVGEENAGTVFRADFTYATGIVKSPLLQPANAPFVGRVRYLDLGFFDAKCGSLLAGDSAAPSPASRLLQEPHGSSSRILLASILAPLAAPRPSQSDKRSYGHLFIVGGSRSYPGAVVLAVRAALRSGVGLVTAFVPELLVAEYAARHPEAMWVGMPVNAGGALVPAGLDRIRERLARASALAIGPGLSADPDALALAGRLVAGSEIPLLLDADALRPEVVGRAVSRPFIVTPHAGEFARIAPLLIEGERVKAPAGVIVAKGPITRILSGPGAFAAPPESETRHPPSAIHSSTFFSLHGGPLLARGGSGDLLAGLTGGLLAQTPADPLLAACRGVVWHGCAADLLARARGQVAVELSDILEHLGRALIPSPCHPPTP